MNYETKSSSRDSTRSQVPIDKFQIAGASLFVTLFLVAAKLIVGMGTGSLAILSQAADSGLDLISVVITLIAVRVSAIPPDHPYGHGKFESLSALAQGLLLLGVTVWILFAAISNLTGVPHPMIVNGWSFGVLGLSIGLDAWRSRIMKKASAQHHSHALEASSLHFFADGLSAIIALVGLAIVKYGGIRTADDWAAIGVAAFVAFLSVRLILRATDVLTDRFTNTADYDRMKSIVERTNGVESVSRIRVRPAGPVMFVEVSILLSRTLPFAAIQRILADVESAIVAEFPPAEVTVHWRPVRTQSEAPFDTLKLISAEYGLLPHNTELARTADGKISLDYHLEFRPGTMLADAEATSREIETRVRKELPDVGPIFVHLEEERSDSHIHEVEEIVDAKLLSAITECANAVEQVRGVRDVHLFSIPYSHSNHYDAVGLGQNLKLVLVLDLPRSLSLHASHEIVTQVEDELRKRFPNLTRILIEAEGSA